MFGRTTTEWGYRTNGRREVWCSSKSEAQSEIRKINRKTNKTGESAKLIQRRVKLSAVKKRPKDPCSGGKCNKHGTICKKHFREKGSEKEWTLYTEDGRNRNNLRWDEEGHRWG